MYTRVIIFIIFLVIICVVNVIIYLRTKSLHKKYDAILDAGEKDRLEAKKYADGEYEEASMILKSLQRDRKRAFSQGYIAKCIGYLQKHFYVRQKTSKTN